MLTNPCRVISKRYRWLIVAIVLIGGLGSSLAFAASGVAVVDQSSTSRFDLSQAGWWSIQFLAPVGQTFTPSFAGLDTVELWVADQWYPECSGGGGELRVNIRDGTVDGPIVGSSSPVTLPRCYTGIAHFDFRSLVPLVPGKLYVVEIAASGDNFGVVWQQIPDPYLHGSGIALGEPGPDVWFQAGLANSIPLTRAYCKNDLWRHLARADGSIFKNQGDCIQYVNTGK